MGRSSGSEHEYLKYSTLTGYFQQDDPTTDPLSYDFITSNFGLRERAYDTDAAFDPDHKKTQWQRFHHHVSKLNEESGAKVQYKVLYLGRHGQGYHNVAEVYYGSEAWDCYWSAQDGNDTMTWSDALLTYEGIRQATQANAFWRFLTTTQKLPLPESYYTSPLLRCLATANITFAGLSQSPEHPFIPTIKEMLREEIGVHTCDRRSSKSVIQKNHPTWIFEEGFEEEDPLWVPDRRETRAAMKVRARKAMDDIFNGDANTHISISSHSGMIAALLDFLGHREFGLGTGQAIPVLVKAEKVVGTLPPVGEMPWRHERLCTEPPDIPLPN